MMRGAEPMTIAELKKHIDRRFVTKRQFKRELSRLATRDDLKGFATRDDLERFATKESLHSFRDEMNDFRRQTLAMHAETMDEMRRGFKEIRDHFTRIVDEHEPRITDLERLHRL
jgi:hypothetical protein